MRKFLIGTDWWTDCDDAAAIRILCRAAKAGQIGIAGIAIDACMEYSAASLCAFIENEGIPLPPVGIDLEATDFGGTPRYQKHLAEESAVKRKNTDFPDAAELYLRVLRESNEPVEIIEIGFPQVLAAVLKKEPELFAEKVRKIWMMAGKWDEDGGVEHNFANHTRSRVASHYFVENSPVPVTFLGWEVSIKVISGSKLEEGDLLKQVFSDHGSAGGRFSWDPMLAELALIGDENEAGYELIRGKASVEEETGANHFAEDVNGIQGYVRKKLPDEIYRDRIDKLIASVQIKK